MKTFPNVIDEKIQELTDKRDNIMSLLGNSGFHASKMAEYTDDLVSQVSEFDGTVEDLKESMKSVLQQFPYLVKNIWTETSNSARLLDNEIKRWNEMKAMYSDWEEYTVESKEREKELIQQVQDEEIEEPTKMKSIRRKPGARPEISLGRHRRLSDQNQGGEDPEA